MHLHRACLKGTLTRLLPRSSTLSCPLLRSVSKVDAFHRPMTTLSQYPDSDNEGMEDNRTFGQVKHELIESVRNQVRAEGGRSLVYSACLRVTGQPKIPRAPAHLYCYYSPLCMQRVRQIPAGAPADSQTTYNTFIYSTSEINLNRRISKSFPMTQGQNGVRIISRIVMPR